MSYGDIVRLTKGFTVDTICPVCKEQMELNWPVSGVKFPKKSATKDHILPKCRYTKESKLLFANGVKNVKIMCASCNQKRGNTDHCIAALVLKRLINGDKRFYNDS